MSTLDEKLAPQRPSVGGRAQATRKQLLTRWGVSRETEDRITIHGMTTEVWRRIHSDVFELEPT